jgi:asparagine synthetase B (glutamine-hydrolysing)
MYFTLAVSAATAEGCAALTDRARITDPAVMPAPGPAAVIWRAPDGRAAMLRWGGELSEAGDEAAPAAATSHAGTIWAGSATPGSGRAPVYARTSLTRVDPVYVAEMPGAVIVSDRATWAASVAGRLSDHDPLLVCALLNPGFPLGSVTPFARVSALPPSTTLHALHGSSTTIADPVGQHADTASSGAVAAGLVAAVEPLREAGQPVELSLTGGKDSRLVAAALVAAGVPVRARTHGFADHPDVVIAAEIAKRLGIEHIVTTPATPGQQTDLLGRLRATVLVADGMLSAFENVGRPDPVPSAAVTAGGHGGELLRGGYAESAAGRRAAPLRAAELLRRLTTRHAGLLRRGAAAGYVASLAPWTAALARGPLQALDDFYLVNRAGRWSAAARQAYLLRENLVQPLFDERVVRAARAVPLTDRVSGDLSRAVLAGLCPVLADVPLAGKAPAGTTLAPFDWRRQYGAEIASFLRDYVLDAPGGLFEVVSRPAAEKVLTPPHADRGTVWALATLACLLSADYRNARDPAPLLNVT